MDTAKVLDLVASLEFVAREMEATYERAYARSPGRRTVIAARDFNAHRIDVEALAAGLRREVQGGQNATG